MIDLSYIDRIEAMGGCDVAMTWLRQNQFPTLEAAWAACERGDWMLWLAAMCPHDRRLIVQAAAACARTAIQCTNDPRVGGCLDVVDRWVAGEATDKEVMAARAEARAAGKAAYAAAWATRTTRTASAAWAADAAAEVAELAAAQAAWASTHRQHAEIVRSILPCPVLPDVVHAD